MSIKPVTGLTITIYDDGTATLSAPDWPSGGHLWAIERQPVDLATLRQVATLLGPDAQEGVDARLRAVRNRLRAHRNRLAALARQAEGVAEALRRIDEEIDDPQQGGT